MTKKELKNSRQFKEALKKSEQARKDGKETAYAYVNNVPLTWCVAFDLNTTTLLIYCYIRDCTKFMKEQAYTGSVKGLCAKFNCTLPTARKSLQELEEKGFIQKEKSLRDGARWVRYVDLLQRYHSKEDKRSLKDILEANKTRFIIRNDIDRMRKARKL